MAAIYASALAGVVAPSCLYGCASYSPHHEASLTPFGSHEPLVAVDALVIDRGLGPEVFGVPEFGLSHRVSPRWDLGGRVYPLGVEFHARHQLARGAGHQLLLMPLMAVGQVSATNADTSFAEVTAGGAMLQGLQLTPSLALTLGFRSQFRLGLNAVTLREDFGAARYALLTGGSVGLSWRLTPRHVLMPGVVALFPYDFDRDAWGFAIVQGGVAFRW